MKTSFLKSSKLLGIIRCSHPETDIKLYARFLNLNSIQSESEPNHAFFLKREFVLTPHPTLLD